MPFISCTYVAPPSPPRPPPQPPWPTAAPLQDCALGAAYIVNKAFAKSYSVDIAMHGWQEGVTILLDYSRMSMPGTAVRAETRTLHSLRFVAGAM